MYEEFLSFEANVPMTPRKTSISAITKIMAATAKLPPSSTGPLYATTEKVMTSKPYKTTIKVDKKEQKMFNVL